MGMNPGQILHGWAMGQLMMVAPELGDSYAGKSAGVLGLLALMLAGHQDRMLSSAPRVRASLETLLAKAETGNPALQAELASALSDEAQGSWTARQDRLMGALEKLHAHADAHDPRLAALCRDFLADYAAHELMDVPDMPV